MKDEMNKISQERENLTNQINQLTKTNDEKINEIEQLRNELEQKDIDIIDRTNEINDLKEQHQKEMNQFKPAIRDAVITNLSSKTSAELATTAGKELAKEQISNDINSILAGEREVIRVSFGQFIIQ